MPAVTFAGRTRKAAGKIPTSKDARNRALGAVALQPRGIRENPWLIFLRVLF
jgi:hypothetical protein